MAKKTIVVCDSCDVEIDGGGATVTIEQGRTKRTGDLCAECASKVPTSRVQTKPGRPPAELTADLTAQTRRLASVKA